MAPLLIFLYLPENVFCEVSKDSVPAGQKASKEALRAVVRVRTYRADSGKLGEGIGFIVSREGVFVTCGQVVHGAHRVEIYTPDAMNYKASRLDVGLKEAGIALCKVEAQDMSFPFLKLAVGTPRENTELYIIVEGSALDYSIRPTSFSGTREILGLGQVFEVAGGVSPSLRGSPVVDASGNVVGIVAGIMLNEQYEGVVVPAEKLLMAKKLYNVDGAALESTLLPLLKKEDYRYARQMVAAVYGGAVDEGAGVHLRAGKRYVRHKGMTSDGRDAQRSGGIGPRVEHDKIVLNDGTCLRGRIKEEKKGRIYLSVGLDPIIEDMVLDTTDVKKILRKSTVPVRLVILHDARIIAERLIDSLANKQHDEALELLGLLRFYYKEAQDCPIDRFIEDASRQAPYLLPVDEGTVDCEYLARKCVFYVLESAARFANKCPRCKGHGWGTCPSCLGTKIIRTDCSECSGAGYVTCPKCEGAGKLPCPYCKGRYRLGRCSFCKGTGFVTQVRSFIKGPGRRVKCPKCGGTGFKLCRHCDKGYVRCKKCAGKGTVKCDKCNGEGTFASACRRCEDGKIRCRRCAGKGYLEKDSSSERAEAP